MSSTGILAPVAVHRVIELLLRGTGFDNSASMSMVASFASLPACPTAVYPSRLEISGDRRPNAIAVVREKSLQSPVQHF
ncbi:hypothetical protein J8I87_28865 [Paraburkholderia sp. LEh10]|uniref:hypothetical protein n=1 Tax=Paraburkholderia sp. LEh10 TaxID=2821353 RepID=UPI001AE48C4D|nr:hypothetical protein [Paraburkholderia sp. LEh10]MBP0593630.1 hypothetical protein [Paraburkholderia sp. LEh10]